MKKLLLGASALVLVTACGGASEEDVAANVADAGSAAVESAEDALAALSNITLRSGDASKAEEALAAMSLATSGDGRVEFTSRDVDGASARFENLSITIPDPNTSGDENPDLDIDTEFEGGLMTISALEFEGLDVTDAGATFSRMTMNGIALEPNDPEEAENADVGIGQFEILNPSPELAAWVSSLMGNGAPAPFPDGDALSFDKMGLSDIVVAVDEPDEGNTADISIASIDFGSAGEDRLGVAALKALSMDITDGEEGQTFNLSLDSITMAGAQTGIVNAFADMAGDAEDAEAAEALFDQLYANPVDPGFDRLEIAGLNFAGEGVNLSMPSFDSFVQRREDGQPTGFITEPYAMTLSADPEGGEAGGELAGALGMIGFETIEVSGKGKSSYDPDTDRLTMLADDNTFEVTDGFAMKFGGEIGGYKAYGAAIQSLDFAELGEGSAEPDPAMMDDMMSALTLHGLEIEFDDNSMVDRVFNLVAAQSGEDPQSVRAQAVGMLGMAPMMAGGMGIDMNIVTEATTALSSFLQSPGTLSIKLNPETPLSADTFASMEDPSGLTKEFLGFSMTHSE